MDDFATDVPPPPGWTEADLERLRARKRKLEEDQARWRAENPPAPEFEELVLAALREQTELLREIRDLLRSDRA